MDKINQTSTSQQLPLADSKNSQTTAYIKQAPHKKSTDTTLSRRKTNIQPANLATLEVSLNADAEFSREVVGGKGMSLKRMQEAGIPVPEFACISLPIINQIEGQLISIELLKPYISNIEEINLQTPSIGNIKDWINNLPESTKQRALQGLYEFIQSAEFYQLIQHTAPADYIRQTAEQLTANSANSQAIMVRSSGIYEDNYGDAQAGKYHSKVNNHADIVKSFLEVYASSFAPGVCQLQGPQPLAVILQKCISCSKGGVVMSYSSLTDDTMRVEYAQGQPRGAVAGQNALCPHHYDLIRSDNSFTADFTLGKVDSHFVLVKHDHDDTYTEVQQPVDTTNKNSKLTDNQLENLYRYVEKLEAMFLCPVDVEFAINKQGKLYIIQVRPITCLAGGVNFAIAPPENTEISGVVASEGFCYGKPILVNSPADAEDIPQGAIIYAESADDWMLEPNFLAKVGGFVLKYGGTADHTAISLRQAQIPCIVVADKFKLPDNPSQNITLVAGNFNGDSCGCVVEADISSKLQVSMTTATGNTEAKVIHREPQVIEFTSVDAGFQWLNAQNTKSLGYFTKNGLIDAYLSPEGLIQLCMQANRVNIFEQLTLEINNLLIEVKDFILGFWYFLSLAGDDVNIDNNLNLTAEDKAELISKINSTSLLINRFEQLQTETQQQLAKLNNDLIACNSKQQANNNFNNWLEQALNLAKNLQELTVPQNLQAINSVHDFIFWLHKEFIDALNLVAIASNQGKIIELDEQKLLFDFTIDSKSLLNFSCMQALKKIYCAAKVVVIKDAVIINATLGVHVAVIELLENSAAGKGRNLRIQLSDNLSETENYSGKLKRFWFLVQILKAMGIDDYAAKLSIEVNEAASAIIIECSHIKTTEAGKSALLKLLVALKQLTNLDISLNNREFFGLNLQWNFANLTRILANLKLVENKTAFNYVLFRLNYLLGGTVIHLNKDAKFLISIARELAETNNQQKIEAILSQLPEKMYQQVIIYFFINDPEKALTFIEPYGYLDNKDFIVDTVICNKDILKYVDHKFIADEEIITQAVTYDGEALEYATAELKNNQQIVMLAAKQKISALEFASFELKDNKEFIQQLVSHKAEAFSYASYRLRADLQLAKLAINKKGWLLADASDEIKNNKEFILQIIKKDVRAIKYVSARLTKDYDIALAAVTNSGFTLKYLDEKFRDDFDLVLLAVTKFGNLLWIASAKLRANKQIVLVAVKNVANALNYASTELQDDFDVVYAAVKNNATSCIRFVSDRLQDNKQIMLEAVKQNKSLLKYASPRLQQDPDILATIKVNASNLLYL